MKQTNFLKKTLMAVALLLGGATFAWADGTISIPQASVGTYIPIGNASTNPKTTATGVTLTGCQVDGSAETSYTVGSTNGSPMSIQFTLTATAGNYLFSFKSGNSSGSATISLSLKNSSNTEVWNNNGNNVSISNTGSWSLTEAHTFLLGDLTEGSYTLTITGVSKTGDYYGNFGNFCFHTPTTMAIPNSGSNLLNVSMATTSGMKINGTYLTEITTNSYADNMYFYVSDEAQYTVYGGFGYATNDVDNFTVTITDMASGNNDVNAQNITVKDYKHYFMSGIIAPGWKKLRLDFPCTTITASFRLEQMYFVAIDELPLKGSATMNLNQSTATFAGCSYESDPSKQNIGNIKGSTIYADNFFVNNTNESAYYNLCANIPWYKNTGKIKITITDVATSTVEVNQQESSDITATGDIMFKLDNAITTGVKKIRFDFTSATTNDYLFNVKNVSFYKRSLNDGYDYTPVAASDVEVVLTRSLPANNWSTIMLPFDRTAAQLQTDLGVTTVTLAAFDEYDSENKQLKFTSASSITANTPYMIKVSSAVSEPKAISGVTISASGDQYVDKNGVRFQGVYASTKMDEGDYFVSGNKLYKASASTKNIKPFRAYFKDVPAGARLSFFDDETTGIEAIDNSQLTIDNYYDLQGRRVAQPSKGMYIVNGKKVVIK